MTRRSPGGIYYANKNDRKRFKKGKNHGGHRQAPATNQRSPNPQSGDAGGDDPINTVTYKGVPIITSPGGISYIDPVNSSLTAAQAKYLQDAYELASQQMFSTLLYGSGHQLSKYFRDPPTRPDLKREMQVGEITGYRAWRLEDGYLRSIYMKDVWFPNRIIEGRGIEDWSVRGVHAWKEPNSEQFFGYIREYMQRQHSPWYDQDCPAIVTGSVFLWGDVVEHEFGYRAEFAKVRSLNYLYPDAKQMGQELRVLHDLRVKYHVV